MPRQKSLITIIRDLVQHEVRQAMQGLLGSLTGAAPKAKAPGKKRVDFPQMPPFAIVGDAKLHDIAAYMLEAGTKAKAP